MKPPPWKHMTTGSFSHRGTPPGRYSCTARLYWASMTTSLAMLATASDIHSPNLRRRRLHHRGSRARRVLPWRIPRLMVTYAISGCRLLGEPSRWRRRRRRRPRRSPSETVDGDLRHLGSTSSAAVSRRSAAAERVRRHVDFCQRGRGRKICDTVKWVPR